MPRPVKPDSLLAPDVRARARTPPRRPSGTGSWHCRPGLTQKGLDAGAETLAAHLQREVIPAPAATTIHRILRAAGNVVPEPCKRPRSSLHRFEAHQPNETWQSDFTHWALAGNNTEILNVLDDQSRYLLHIKAYPRVTGPAVVEAFLDTASAHGLSASTLTDNGMVYTT
ncbi:MAG: hypothetical protein NVS1B16_00690 [Pseudarthrobacter sp.]